MSEMGRFRLAKSPAEACLGAPDVRRLPLPSGKDSRYQPKKSDATPSACDPDEFVPSNDYFDEQSDEADPVPTPEELAEMREADRDSIRVHFETKFEPKVSRIRELHEAGDKDEAFLLAVCYIDGLASWLDSKERSSRRRFAHFLLEHGRVEGLCDIPAKHLRVELNGAFRSDAKLKKRVIGAGLDANDVQEEINEVVSSISEETLTLESAEALFAQRTDEATTALLKPELYRGTNAGLLYKYYRNPLVHSLDLDEVDLVLPDGSV